METVEINAGAWYLRGLRDDDRVSDVPALAETGLLWAGDGTDGESAARFVRDVQTWWSQETRFVWAVCEPTTGELIALIGLVRDPRPPGDRATVHTAHRVGAREALSVGLAAVTRFAEGALDLTVSPPQV
ncbi:GNAT family N-acetyltransferase [Williamsia sp. M5A3_1d]